MVKQLLLLLLLLNNFIFASNLLAAPNSIPSNQTILTELVAINLTEQLINNRSVIVITFSQNLEPNQNFNNFITITSNGVQVKGLWQLDKNTKRLYFENSTPNTTYRVQIRPGLVSDNSLYFNQPTDLSIQTRALAPNFDFTARSSILPTQLTDGLPIRVFNIPEVELEFLRVEPQNLSKVLSQLNLSQGLNIYDLNTIREFTTSVYTERHKTLAKPDTITVITVPVESIEELKAPGLYFAVMRQPGTFGEQAYRLSYFIVSDLALQVRRYTETLDVFANSFKTGTPFKDISIQLYSLDSNVLTTKTDNEGHAHFASLPKSSFLVLAHDSSTNNLAFIDLRDKPLDLIPNNNKKLVDQPISIFFYTSKQLLRPNESMDTLFLVRDRAGLPLDIKEINFRLKNPEGKIILDQVLQAQAIELGYFADNFNLPKNAMKGQWTIEIRLKDTDPNPLNSFKFQVESYMPEWLSLKLTSSVQEINNSSKLIFALQGETFNKKPASNYAIKFKQTALLNHNPLSTLPDFYFGDARDSEQIKINFEKDLALSPSGGAFIELDNKTFNTQTPLVLQASAQLLEVGGYSIERSLQQTYWPANALVGIKPLFNSIEVNKNQTVSFELAKWDKNAKRTSLSGVIATLLKAESNYYWDYTENGWKKVFIKQSIPLLQKKLDLIESANTPVSFPVGQGEYWLEVLDPTTQFKTTYYFQVTQQTSETEESIPNVKMLLDKNAYKVGEKLELKVIPPFAGEALITVESDHLLWSKRTHLAEEGTLIEIPLDYSWKRHDIYISATVLKSANKMDNFPPTRAVGLVNLPLDRKDRTLELKVDVPSKVLPEQLVSFKVIATNLKDSKALVVISATPNELKDVQAINPASLYFSARQYSTNQFDNYNQIVPDKLVSGFSSSDKVISNDFSDNSTSDYKISSGRILLNNSVAFDSKGEAIVKLTMPSDMGKFSLTAIAFGETQLGSTSEVLNIQAPVSLNITAPSFLAAEDTTKIEVRLTNISDQAQNVKLLVGTNDFLNLASTTDHEYLLERDQTKVIYLPLKASRQFGSGNIELALSGKNFNFHKQLNILVRSAYPRLQRSRLYNITSEDGAVTLDKSIIQNLQTDSIKARLTLSNTPELSMRAGLDDLLAYPYESLESIISKYYPYLFLDPNQADLLGLIPFSLDTREQSIKQGIAQLSSLQLSNGGFSAWQGQLVADTWLSAYAADFLLDAQEQGFNVPQYLLEGVLKYLESQIILSTMTNNVSNTDNSEHLNFATRAYSAYILARVKRVSLANLRAWYDQESKKSLSSLPLIHMGLALYMRTESERSKEAFDLALTKLRDEKLNLGDYGSHIRDLSWSLALLLKYKIAIPNLDERLKELNRLIYIRNYYTPQELWAFFQVGRQVNLTQALPDWSAQLMLQSRGLQVKQKEPYRLPISARELNAGVTVKAESAASIHTTLEIQGYMKPPLAEKNDFFQLQRTFYTVQGRVKNPEQLQLGDLIIVKLQVTANEDVERSLLVDLLPGGWVLDQRNIVNVPELSNLILEGTDKSIGQLLKSTTFVAEQFDLDRYWCVLNLHKKVPVSVFYLARVAYAGQFKQPPSVVTDLDYPERLGISTALDQINISTVQEQ